MLKLNFFLRYNVKRSPETNSFTLTAMQSTKGRVTVCAAYTGNKIATDMVIIEVELLTG